MATTFSVTQAALVKRINRRLKSDGRRIRKNRGRYLRASLGDYCIFSDLRNLVSESHVNIEELGRRLGVMAEHERMDAAA